VTESPEHVSRNRIQWDAWAHEYVRPGRKNWESEEPTWGIWSVPESHVGMLPPDLGARDTIELGCGTAYVSAWMARRGARPVGIDNSPAQLETARAFQREFGLDFPLLQGNAEEVPFPDASFDFAISEYGASVWCDPALWLDEASRLLRPEGVLIFFTPGSMLLTCTPVDGSEAGTSLVRDYFGRYRVEFPGEDTVEFHLTHSDWIRVLRERGFILEDLIEIQPPASATPRLVFASLDWARRWPSEEVWVARKLAF
jgi:SAM-dependent methyltransferase